MPAPIALTMGDPAGVGPELSLAAHARLKNGAPFYLVGDVRHMRALAAGSGQTVAAITAPDDAAAVFADALPVLDLPLANPVTAGTPDLGNAAAVIGSIEAAVAQVHSGVASAVVTNPISKLVLREGAGFAFPGHTEFLAHLAGVSRSVMLLAAPALRVIPVTIHIPVSDVPAALTPEVLEQTLRIAHHAMISDFGLPEPRIAVAGLNPHAGEGGTMGHEDASVIAPVLERLRGEGMDLRGPLPGDTMFHPAARAGYDLAVCMYHDQALIPIKTLDFEHGVNATLGLPFIRTSPDHGTAFDIAGRGIASAESLIAAIEMAASMTGMRAR
ncbi:4-hydroxythreonine-4-phosphate dehydrogenase PdxA [Algicella marina]|uniref:4-hydroxythreonine-4-phosphate dehydrogenase n=1 Tax=Algicella marina TaxID=2683284 RepID=A0A6P1SZP0_9RHOB|nr:4-hydroxythreonine-4-phosphate dehydrogenase PdxA [Algicella marina]QHQ34921.1 4-hydroxythreonine-4-phosphate dehydrogenase PdxA [Algicella marina]